jgi:hypothetical protein
MKDATIVIRVEANTKNDISALAKSNKRELSDYLRLLIKKAINSKIKF